MKLNKLIKKSLEEDNYKKDITSIAFDNKLMLEAEILAKKPGIICGLHISKQIFQTVDRKLKITLLKKEGDKVCPKNKTEPVLKVSGRAKSILASERTALNFLQHLSGIATLTNKFVNTLGKSRIQIRDTRKTLPLLRSLEKYAVKIGGGKNQRKNLADQVLFKDNHWQCLKKNKISLKDYFVKLKKELSSDKKLKKNKPILIQVEVKNLAEIKQILEIKPDIILLDNMPVNEIKKALILISGKTKVEISGNINLKNIKNYKELNIDYISIGALTHSAPALDLSLEIK